MRNTKLIMKNGNVRIDFEVNVLLSIKIEIYNVLTNLCHQLTSQANKFLILTNTLNFVLLVMTCRLCKRFSSVQGKELCSTCYNGPKCLKCGISNKVPNHQFCKECFSFCTNCMTRSKNPGRSWCEHCFQESRCVKRSHTFESVCSIRFYDKSQPFYQLTNFFFVVINFPSGTYFNVPDFVVRNTWPSSEHAYQASKFLHREDIMKLILIAKSPKEAFNVAHNYHSAERPDWHQVKLDIMEKILRIKFSNPALKSLLSSTKPCQLIESSPTDYFWGEGDGSGLNHLGKLLMKIRDSQ